MTRRILTVLFILILSGTAFAQTLDQPITLKSGFNFVSFTASVNITAQQLKSLNASIEDIYLYSAAAGSFLSVSEGTLTSLSAGKGYIIKSGSQSDTTITVQGAQLSAIGSISLKQGFNLIGFSKTPSINTTFSQLMNLYSAVTGIYKWSPAAGSFLQVIRDRSGSVVLIDGVDPAFKAGESYFMNITADTSINYDGASIYIGANPVDPNTPPAEISGTLNSSEAISSAPALNIPSHQASGEDFTVTLLDTEGNAVPPVSLAEGDSNPKTIKDGQTYSFKIKNFTKSYKVIAVSKTTANKMVSVFIGTVGQEEKIIGRDLTPVSTAICMIYADSGKSAAAFKLEEEIKKADANFKNRIMPYIIGLEAKRQAVIKDNIYDTPEKLERAYKDAVIGSFDANEIAKIREGFDAVTGKSETGLTVSEKLKDALALIAASGKRQNETEVKKAQSQLESIIASTDNDSANRGVNSEAKIAYGLVCNDLGNIYKNKVSTQTGSASGPRSLMAAYQAIAGELDPRAKAEFEKGYKKACEVQLTVADNESGRDKSLAAALLKNASELAAADPAKLDEAKQKADVLIAKLESENITQITLPNGETLDKDKILEKKGEALINASRPAEAVGVFSGVSEEKIKNFGLGRAYMKLNDIENAYRTLKNSVKAIVKNGNGAEARMSAEQTFQSVNEALFAFAAVLDRIINYTAEDSAMAELKNKIVAEEQSASDSSDAIINDPAVTVSKIILSIKSSTNYFEVGKKIIIDNPSQQGFGNQFAGSAAQTDAAKTAFNEASKLLLKANQLIESARSASSADARKVFIYHGSTKTGTLNSPGYDTALKLAAEARSAFEQFYADPAVAESIKGDAHFHIGLAYISYYNALKLVEMEDAEYFYRARKIFIEIREKVSLSSYSHLKFALTEIFEDIESIEKRNNGVTAESGGLVESADAAMKRAMSFYHGKETVLASGEFQKAFLKYEEVYNSTDAKITLKMKEAALYYGAYCLHYKYKLMVKKDESVKIKIMEKLKLLRLKFPESNFVSGADSIINEHESNIALTNSNDASEPVSADKPRPGDDFIKALVIMEKLRLYYQNNYSLYDIGAAFGEAETIFKDITDNRSTDTKYTGTIAAESDLKSLRAAAAFHRAVMHLQRYTMHNARDIAYKNMALKIFNDFVMQFPEEPLVAEAQKYMLKLQNEGAAAESFAEGRPVFANIVYNPRTLDLTVTNLRDIYISVDMAPYDSAAANAIASVKVELKRFGNTVFTDTASQTPAAVALSKNSAFEGRWEGKLSLGASISEGVYDAVTTAVTAGGLKADTAFQFTVKNATVTTYIRQVEILPDTALKITADGAGTSVYASVMQVESGWSVFDRKLLPVVEAPANIMLEPVYGETGKFKFDIRNKLPNLKAGNYVFLFKLINSGAGDIQESLNKPVHIFEFPHVVKQDIAAADKTAVRGAYDKILTAFNDTAKTGAERTALYEKMFVSENYKMPEGERAGWIKFFDSLNGLRITVDGEPAVELDPNVHGRAAVRAFWKIEGSYKVDIPAGVFLPDGVNILPAGRAGFTLQNFFIRIERYFVRSLAGDSWGLTPRESSAADANAPLTITEDKKPLLSKLSGAAFSGGAVRIEKISSTPFLVIEGSNLNAASGDKRVLKLSGGGLTVPAFLCDSGNIDWSDNFIKFTTSPLRGLSGKANLEIYDSRYGTLLSAPVDIAAEAPVSSSTAVGEIVSGEQAVNPFGLLRPFEIDRSKAFIIKGAKLKPVSGKYSLKYYRPAVNGFVEIINSTAAGWTDALITVPAEFMPQAANMPDLTPTTIIVWDDVANKALSGNIFVIFINTAQVSGDPVISLVNGQDPGAGAVNITSPADGSPFSQLTIGGKYLKNSNKLRIDLIFSIDGRIEAVPVAFNNSDNWGAENISFQLDWSKLIGKTNYGAMLVIFDETLRKETGIRIAVKFILTAKTAAPVMTPAGGSFTATREVSIASATAGSAIYYTLDGTSPSAASVSSKLYSTPIILSAGATIKAVAIKAGMAESNIAEAVFTKLDLVSAPVFKTASAEFQTEQLVEITCATAGAVIYYTLDGTEPAALTGTAYSAPFKLTAGAVVKAIAVKAGMADSVVAEAVYTKLGVAAIAVFKFPAGDFVTTQEVVITCATAGATVKYTLDGTAPSSSAGYTYSAPFVINSTTTVKAIAIKTGMADSEVSSVTYKKLVPSAAAVFAQAGVVFTGTKEISITCATDGAIIKYTTDGTAPSQTNGVTYSAPFVISATTTVKAITYKTGMAESAPVTATFTRLELVAQPTVTPFGGIFETTREVTITCATDGATIKYTLDGTTPSQTSGLTYSAPFVLSSTAAVKAMAFKAGMADSAVLTANFTKLVPVAAPILPAAETFASTREVTITCATAGAIIKYTLDGTTPSQTNGLTYSTPFAINATTKVKVIAVKDGMAESPIAAVIYTKIEMAATPVFTVASGTMFASSQEVAITCATLGAAIKYTLDGTEPSATNGITYSVPFVISATTNIRAVAIKSGMTNSTVASAVYTRYESVATPSISPNGGAFDSAQTVTITCATIGATLKYTLDGTTPSATAGLDYTAPVVLGNSAVIKAIAYKVNMTNSAVATANFTINVIHKVATPMFSPVGGTYSQAQQVSITCATADAKIYYTLDGTTPTTSNYMWSAPINITQATTIKAIAVKPGMVESNVAETQFNVSLIATDSNQFAFTETVSAITVTKYLGTGSEVVIPSVTFLPCF